MVEFSGNGLFLIYVPILIFLILLVLALQAPKRWRRRHDQIKANQAIGLYKNPEFIKRIRILIVVEVFIILGVFISALIAVFENSLVWFIPLGILCLLSLFGGFLANRLIINGVK